MPAQDDNVPSRSHRLLSWLAFLSAWPQTTPGSLRVGRGAGLEAVNVRLVGDHLGHC